MNIRNRLTPTLERALKARDNAIADQVVKHSKENQEKAKELNTKYTDPNALLTGFRRDEHVGGVDNEAWLRVQQGLPAHKAPGERDVTDMNPKLLEFLSKDLYVKSKDREGAVQGRGRVRTVEEEEVRGWGARASRL